MSPAQHVHLSEETRLLFSAYVTLQNIQTLLLPFFSQTVSTASELRKPIYWIVAAKAIDYEQMLLLMAGVKWDIREIMSQHNVYVDVLLKVTLRSIKTKMEASLGHFFLTFRRDNMKTSPHLDCCITYGTKTLLS